MSASCPRAGTAGLTLCCRPARAQTTPKVRADPLRPRLAVRRRWSEGSRRPCCCSFRAHTLQAPGASPASRCCCWCRCRPPSAPADGPPGGAGQLASGRWTSPAYPAAGGHRRQKRPTSQKHGTRTPSVRAARPIWCGTGKRHAGCPESQQTPSRRPAPTCVDTMVRRRYTRTKKWGN